MSDFRRLIYQDLHEQKSALERAANLVRLRELEAETHKNELELKAANSTIDFNSDSEGNPKLKRDTMTRLGRDTAPNQQPETLPDAGKGNHAGTEPKPLNKIDNEFKFSGLLNIPSGVDVWFEVIDVMTKDYYLQHNNSKPTKAQAWVKLCTEPPTDYGITVNKDNQSLTMVGVDKPFNKRSFERRWANYTTESNHIEPN